MMLPEPVPPRRPAVFILGMLPRSGTNHLADLFELHDDVTVLKPVYEDHLVRWSPLLTTYVEQVARHWSPEWQVPDHEGPDLLRCLGDGIVNWLAGHGPGTTVVTKMPRVENIDRFFDLFADSALVVLVRDGRSVVESGVRSFGWTYEDGFRTWADAAARVIAVRDRHGDDPRLQIVRYEDLIDDESGVMKRLCVGCGLDPARFDTAGAAALPVRGSSTLAGTGELHWRPVERPATFDPRQRWHDWDARLHRRFAAVAGPLQEELGYDLEPVGGGDTLIDRARNLEATMAARRRELIRQLGRTRRVARSTWW